MNVFPTKPHWKVLPLKRLDGHAAQIVQTGPFGAQLHASDYVEEGIPLILIKHVQGGRIQGDMPRIGVEKARDLSAYTVQSGDVVFSRVGSVGRAALVSDRESGWLISGQMLRLRVRSPELDKRFLMYVIESAPFIEYMALVSLGSTRDSINTSILRDAPVPLPPLEEQHTIADFLDRGSAQVDGLIAKNHLLLESIEAEREALIRHAVTGGLSARTRPIGCLGIDAIPADWNLCQLRRRWKVIDCKHRTASYVDDGVPIVSTTEVKPGRINLNATRRTSIEEYLDLIGDGRRPKRGDIVYSRNASVGSAAYVDTDQKFCMGQDVCLITSSDQDQLFLSYQLNCRLVLDQLDSMMVGATFKRINVGQIKTLLLCVPPANQQKKLANYLDTQTSVLDGLVLDVNRAIEKLHEYRSSLISAAVTGQLDVRDYRPREAAVLCQ